MARLSFAPVLFTLCLTILTASFFFHFAVVSPGINVPLIPGRRVLHEQGPLAGPGDGEYILGVGKADITGPVVEINLMGYADTDQSGSGLRQRLYTRAFVVGSLQRTASRIVYLVLDTQSGDTAVRHGILEELKKLGPEYDLYNKDNIAVTGTHSHSGPGAWLNYLLPQITSKGFDKKSYEAIVSGSVLAIQRAHASLVPGHLSLGTQKIADANINRSPYAYLKNNEQERGQYAEDVDKTMTVLKFERASDGLPMGILSWFPVHGTSLYQNNTLITGDNKGVAAYLLEEYMRKKNPEFVAGFSQANVGDTSPNTFGAFCADTGMQCSFNDSTCGGRTQPCHGRGPMFRHLDQGTKSCFDIGSRQMAAARDILHSDNLERISASTVSFFHTYANFSSFSFTSPFNQSRKLKTCSAALGHGFAGGTTDGPGAFDFSQGTNDTGDSPSLKNPLWRFARNFLHEPTDEQIACQSPKPILLDVGHANSPYAWTPNIVDIQLLRIGRLVMIISPGEATTMSGRRWQNALAEAAPSVLAIDEPHVVLGGPANTYAHYIATEEEYGVQRYEGASTLYGPHTLEAYINLTLTYLPYLGSEKETSHLRRLPPGPSPPINVNASLSFINPVIIDRAGFLRKFGATLSSPDPAERFAPGSIVKARFVGANPRNNYRPEGTFAAVEKFDHLTGQWIQVRSDRDWFLVYKWERKNTALATSEVSIEWEIEPGTESGMYRLKYYGDAKALGGKISAIEGTSGIFNVAGDADGTTFWDELIRF
ncbi:N-acylsphingosine amidohydrolase [Exophiala viscosa]|uniref:Neutral ceramidase n=1 Tax=Exophiala viscosa TaxID=2486360 RepID=A0AAN6DPW8_9EURO|nr:N-acylsphingosine amidohydrolase [Exophiala viscosa]KAI1620634.1 N-acylsphingosine amidohydrolase [Exophiala viscosa]